MFLAGHDYPINWNRDTVLARFFSFTDFALLRMQERMSIAHDHRRARLATFGHACISGSNASLLSGIALSICSKLEEGSAAGALNGPSQWIWGEDEAHTRRATVRHTLVGYLIHHASSIFWAVGYERAFGCDRNRELARVPWLQILAEGALTAALAYCVDYHVTPKRLRPGFKKHLGPVGIFASYAAFGLGLALTTLARKPRANR